ncbi:methionine aminotransferase [Sphingobacterium sp. lm-10]|uniref:methionine aminotransferase n=1 Tax=Sphingobacterium sp. lm-10 TaxID=2944904 RepID=UPI0020228CD1|nr:methionine aminotransferase [Sphingobacterium sp. lm-10]MCL7989345.1 methionine aminotransferase [Sphingobacterium sp. lm-10]
MTTPKNILLTSKLPNTGNSIFSKMTALAQQYQAINLAQGFPDFPVDPKLLDLVSSAMHQQANQYAPMPGLPLLRERIAEKYQSFYHVNVDPESEITITNGATQAIFTTIATIIHAGDEVIIFEPAYDCYRPTIELFGGKVIAIPLVAPEFTVDWQQVAEQVTDRTRMVIINNPGNPSCTVWTKEDLLQLQKIITRHELIVLSDEVYEHIIYDERQHQSALLFDELRARSFVIASFGKLLHCTGWKLGYVVAPKELTAEFRKIHQQNVFSVNTPMQHAIAAYLDNPEYYHELSTFMQGKRDRVINGLASSAFRITPSAGTYFLLLDYKNISHKTEMDFAMQLIEQHGVALIPIAPFYHHATEQHTLRLCFAKKEETLDRAIQLLNKVS